MKNLIYELRNEFAKEVRLKSQMGQDYPEIPNQLWYLKRTLNASILNALHLIFMDNPELELKENDRLVYWDSSGVWGICASDIQLFWYKSGCGLNTDYFTSLILATIKMVKKLGRADYMDFSLLPRKAITKREIISLLWVGIKVETKISSRLALRLARLTSPSRAVMIDHINHSDWESQSLYESIVQASSERYGQNNRARRGTTLGHTRVDWSLLNMPIQKKLTYMSTEYQTKWYGNRFGIPIWNINTKVLKIIGVINSKKEMEFIIKNFVDGEDEHEILGLRGIYSVFGKDRIGAKRFLRNLAQVDLYIGEVAGDWSRLFADVAPDKRLQIKSLLLKDVRYAGIMDNIMPVMEELERPPKSFEEAQKIVLAFRYSGVVDTHSALICAEYGLSQNKFEKVQKQVLKRLLKPLKQEQLPMNISLFKDGYTVRFLERGDPLGLILGKVTNCCQTIGDVGGSCAKAGFNDYDKGFLVIEKGDEIITQSWVWMDKSARALVLDSIESKGLSESRLKVITNLLHLWVQKVCKESFMVNEVLIGRTNYGVTQSVTNGLSVYDFDYNYSPRNYEGYMDGNAQRGCRS